MGLKAARYRRIPLETLNETILATHETIPDTARNAAETKRA